MKISYYKIGNEFKRIQKDYFKKIKPSFLKGDFVNSKSNKKFEKNICKLLKVKYACGVGNGSDALEIAMIALGIKKNDEVITASNSWVSSLTSIINIGARPVLVDVNDQYNIDCSMAEKAITKKTKAIMPVHLNGLPADMSEVMRLAKKYNLKVIEDSAQAILSKYENKFVGTIGNVGCFSMHPTKNLGVAGDGGFIVTKDKKIFNKIKLISNHGQNFKGQSIMPGRNSRLDAIQAELINLKIKFLNNDTKRIIKIAKKYSLELKDFVEVPYIRKKINHTHTYHRYVIMLKNKSERTKLKQFLKINGIETKIHYPVPLHKYKCFSYYSFKKRLKKSESQSDKILSLPCNQFMTDKETDYIIRTIKKFFKK